MPSGVYKRTTRMKIGKNPNSRNGFKKGHGRIKNNKGPLGKRWKVKNTSNYTGANGFQKGNKLAVGNTNNFGKHWKIKDTSKMKGHSNKKRINPTNELIEFRKRSSQKSKERLERDTGKKCPEKCEICGVFEKDLKKKLCYDHNHKTGEFRGWICNRCNIVLGFVKDDKKLLIKLIKYLEK